MSCPRHCIANTLRVERDDSPADLRRHPATARATVCKADHRRDGQVALQESGQVALKITGPLVSVLRKAVVSRNWCPEPTYREQVVSGVRGTVRVWRTCWAVTRSGSGAVLAALCGRISYRTLVAFLSGRGSAYGTLDHDDARDRGARIRLQRDCSMCAGREFATSLAQESLHMSVSGDGWC